MNKLWDISKLWARVDLEIYVRTTKWLRLGIKEDEQIILGREKVTQVDSFIYLSMSSNKDYGYSEDVKSRIAKTKDIFS